MTNANALPIQERLRDGERRFLKWAYKEQYSGPPVLSIPRHPDNVDALLAEAADRIDALEDALELADARFHMHGMATMTKRLEEYGYEHEAKVHDLDAYRAALGE